MDILKEIKRFHADACFDRCHAQYYDQTWIETTDEMGRYLISDCIDWVYQVILYWLATRICKRHGHLMEIEEYLGNDTAGADFYCERCGYSGRHIYF